MKIGNLYLTKRLMYITDLKSRNLVLLHKDSKILITKIDKTILPTDNSKAIFYKVTFLHNTDLYEVAWRYKQFMSKIEEWTDNNLKEIL